MSNSSSVRSTAVLRHSVLVVLGYTSIFCWVFGEIVFRDAYLADTDLYDWFLPIFFSPIQTWASAIYAGHPTFADTSVPVQYPVQFLFSRVIGSWSGYVVAAYVLASSFTYAYVWHLTKSRSAAWVAGLAYGLSEALIERHAHINIVHAFAWFPLIMLGTERLLAEASPRWIAVGAVALANCFLSGHPQPIVYAVPVCMAYGIAGARAFGHSRSWYLRFAGMFVLGALLSAIKALPFLEAVSLIGRSTLRFEAFTANSNTLPQMLAVVFPTIEHSGRDASVYVGLATLTLAAVSVCALRSNWRVRVWLVVAVVTFLIGAGEATPVARLLYAVPPFDRFRIASRMLFLFAFSAATLGGLGIAFLQRDARSRQVAARAAGGMLLAMTAGAAALLALGGRISFEPRVPLPWALPVWNSGVWVQLGIAVVTAAVLLAMARRTWFAPAVAALSLVVGGDLLYSLPYRVSGDGIHLDVVPARELAPSVHAKHLARMLDSTRQRLLAARGTTRDALVPAGFARLWNIPIAGGYSPIVPERLAVMARMGSNGDIRAEVLALEDRALDLLSVKYVTVREDDYPQPPTFERDGLTWNSTNWEMPLEYPVCNSAHARSRALQLPHDVTVSGIAMIAYLRCAEDTQQGAEVVTVDVVAPDGTVERFPLRAGIEIAETALADPSVSVRAKHQAAPVFDDPALRPNQHLVRLALARPVRGPRLVLTGSAIAGWAMIERLTLLDENGRSVPQDFAPLLLEDRERWRVADRVRTSRVSDRESDEDAVGEITFTVYENRRALPRAWIVGSVAELDDAGVLQAVRYSQAPDGRPWDPLREAFVPQGGGTMRVEPGKVSAHLSSVSDGRIEVNVASSGGGFLVLSETYYPGWRARVGEQTTSVQRTNLTLQGVAVPAGRHTVVFEFRPWTLWAGTALSLAALGLTLVLVVLPPTCAATRSNRAIEGNRHVPP